MFPAAFDYLRPETVDEAIALLNRHGDDAKLLAGGHSLLPAMRLRLAEPKVLIDIGRLQGLNYIRRDGTGIAIGALTTHAEIERSELLARDAGCLVDAAQVLADPQVRNRGTIGGVLAHADPAADYPACLLALGATVQVMGRDGSRTVPIAEWFAGPFMSALAPDEIITAVHIPVRAGDSAYRKFVRRASDYGMTGVAAFVSVDDQGVCTDVRIGITCVSSMMPYRATAVEDALKGLQLTPEVIAEASMRAADDVDVADDPICPAAYRTNLCQVETRRAVIDALARAKG